LWFVTRILALKTRVCLLHFRIGNFVLHRKIAFFEATLCAYKNTGHVCVCVCACVFECICMCMRVCACVCVCMYVYVYVRVCVCVCVVHKAGPGEVFKCFPAFLDECKTLGKQSTWSAPNIHPYGPWLIRRRGGGRVHKNSFSSHWCLTKNLHLCSEHYGTSGEKKEINGRR